MRHYRGSRYYGSNIAFIDMLFNIIVVVTMLYLLSVMLINPPKNKDIEAKADMLVVLTWSDGSPHDIDLWVKAPSGERIGYLNRESTYISLDRDDRGSANNYFINNNNEREMLKTRREVISLRATPDGRYLANVFFFRSADESGATVPYDEGTELPVKVELIRINPSYQILATKEIKFTQVGQERTGFSFIINSGTVSELNTDLEEYFIAFSPER